MRRVSLTNLRQRYLRPSRAVLPLTAVVRMMIACRVRTLTYVLCHTYFTYVLRIRIRPLKPDPYGQSGAVPEHVLLLFPYASKVSPLSVSE